MCISSEVILRETAGDICAATDSTGNKHREILFEWKELKFAKVIFNFTFFYTVTNTVSPMGNCWRMPEDHSGLVDVSATHFGPPSTSSTVPPSNSYLAFTHPDSTTSNTLPKLVILSRSSADLDAIKAAQCRNLVEHLPLIAYNEATVKQTECDICLMDFVPDEQVRQLPCDGGHIFHPCCIDQWLLKSLTCPHCSTNVDAALLLKFIPHAKNLEGAADDDDDW